MTSRATLPAIATLAALSLSACVANGTSDGNAISVSSTDDACLVSAATAPSGTVVFSITNDGTDVTEFYLYGEDGVAVVSEVENIGPGLSRDLVVRAAPGTYFTACKPGMEGDGIRAEFVVTDSGETIDASGERAQQLEAASANYVTYVRGEVAELSDKTAAFVAHYVAFEDDDARALYADARVHWERIEPVAEAFGDLDPSMDAREADLAVDELWTGWHHMEKNLWPANAEGGIYELTADERTALGDKLLADTATLVERVNAADFTVEPFAIGNGAKELMDEVASGKITGEEEIWSHTDLWDFQANVQGAHEAFEVLEPVVKQTDPDLVEEIDKAFADLNALLATHGSIEDGFVLYTELTGDDIRALEDAVNALGEPLSHLTAAALM